MSAICASSIKAKAIRVIRLDACGNPVAGATGLAVSEGFIKVDLTPDIEAGQEFTVKNANGDLCVNDIDAPRLKRYKMSVDLCNVDPDVIELMTGARIIRRISGGVTSDVGNAIGESDAADNNFGLEVWTRIAGGNCGTSNDRYFHWVVPWVKNAILGAFSFQNGPLTVTVNGDSQANPNYGHGPFDLWTAPVGSDEHLAWQITSTAPPTSACGFQTLVVS